MASVDGSKSTTRYSPEEADRIREMIRSGVLVVCPICDQSMTTGMPIAGGGTVSSVFELRCEPCGRLLHATDMGAPRSSE